VGCRKVTGKNSSKHNARQSPLSRLLGTS
jgi:hypothetical protein